MLKQQLKRNFAFAAAPKPSEMQKLRKRKTPSKYAAWGP
jgi:hypothetical protein